LAVIGDLKQMSPRWLVGTSMLGSRSDFDRRHRRADSILSEEILQYTTVTDDQIIGTIVDYSDAYPTAAMSRSGEVTYAQLKRAR